ncbi:MAG: hypothetical protein ACK2UB_01630 [Anaerolineales bacterium]|jgi:hypothetical protein
MLACVSPLVKGSLLRRLKFMGWACTILFGCSLISSTASGTHSESSGEVQPAAFNAPGSYAFSGRCLSIPLISIDMVPVGGGPGQPPNLVPMTRFASLSVCLTGVTVQEDRTMRFEIEYVLAPMQDETNEVWRESDQDNRNVYLTDDKDNRYDFLEAGGCAAQELRTQEEECRCSGWFLFPPAGPKAEMFGFHYAPAESDAHEGMDVIQGIVLIQAE